MSGQICTTDPRDLEFDQLCNDVARFLDARDFRYQRHLDSYDKILCYGSLHMVVSFNKTNRSVVISVNYHKKKSNGEPEILNSTKFSDIIEFIREFDIDD